MKRFTSSSLLYCLLMCTLSSTSLFAQSVNNTSPAALELALRFQSESSAGSGRFHSTTRQETWNLAETAIVVCDVWDLHHCLNAVRRLEQFAPRLNAVLQAARSRGATIIHAPSDCMPAYAQHPARRRAIDTPPSVWVPHEVAAWC